MTETVGAAKGERSTGRLGYRCGNYSRRLVTRVGKLELRVLQDMTDPTMNAWGSPIGPSRQLAIGSLCETVAPQRPSSTAAKSERCRLVDAGGARGTRLGAPSGRPDAPTLVDQAARPRAAGLRNAAAFHSLLFHPYRRQTPKLKSFIEIVVGHLGHRSGSRALSRDGL